MSYDIGPRIGIEGEVQFRQALKEIDASLKVNKSEVALYTSEFDKNAASMEALTAKSKVLEGTFATQTSKLKLLESELQKSAQKTGEASAKTEKLRAEYEKAKASTSTQTAELTRLKVALEASAMETSRANTETQKLQLNYNNTQAALNKTAGELDKNSTAMEKATKGSLSLADAITGITDVAGIQVPPAMQGMISKLDEVSASGAALIGVLAGTIVALGKMTISTAKTADEILTLSSTTGLSTDALQEFTYASELLDVSSETMQSSMTKMIRSMNSAREGTGTAAEAYQRLHINVTNADGSLRDANTVFYEAIDALGKMSNETDRDALSMEIFGKSARELNPLIEAGSGRLRELAEEAHNVGYVMDNETLGKFGELDDAMQRMDKQGDALKRQFSEAMLPAMLDFFDMLDENKDVIKDVADFLAVMVGIISDAVEGVFNLIRALDALFSGDFEKFSHLMTTTDPYIEKATSSARGAVKSLPAYATGTRSAERGPALVGENGPEIRYFDGGETVIPAGRTRALLAGGGTTTVSEIYNITIDAKNVKEFNDVVTMAKNARQERRAR